MSLLFACSSTAPPDRKLEFYGDAENTDLIFNFDIEEDSLNFKIRFFDPLTGWYNFDTLLIKDEGAFSFVRRLALPKPTQAEVMVNGFRDTLFLVPKMHAQVMYGIGAGGLAVQYSDRLLGDINHYYDNKLSLGGGLYMMDFYRTATFIGSLPDVFAAYDSMVAVQHLFLDEATTDLHLPQWFVDYELKSIDYRDICSKVSAHRVRRIIGEKVEPIPTELDLRIDDFDLSDEEALACDRYLGSLKIFAGSPTDTFEIKDSDPDPIVQYDLWWENGQTIENRRIRDVYNSQLWCHMKKSSFVFPDTLLGKVRRSISDDMQPFISRLESEISRLEGKKAPNFYLKNLAGDLIDLKGFRGNVVLLDFWFVGCPFCKKEVPFARELVRDLKDEQFRYVQVCMRSDVDSWKNAQDDHVGITLHSNRAWDQKLARSYQIQGYPRYVLIDPEGEIIDWWSARPSDPALRGVIDEHLAD